MGKAKRELEILATNESRKALERLKSIEKRIREGSLNLKRKRNRTQLVMALSLGLILLLGAQFLGSFVVGLWGKKSKQTAEKFDIVTAVEKDSSRGEAYNESLGEILEAEETRTTNTSKLEPVRVGSPIESSSIQTSVLEQDSAPPLKNERAERKPAEKKRKKSSKLQEETEPYIESPPPGRNYTVNVGSFKERSLAEQYVKELARQGLEAFGWEIELPEKGKWHRVSIGKFTNRKQAEHLAKELERNGFKTFVAKLIEYDRKTEFD